uniref:Uncharacterized protein n=1 Tax=Rhizophora mucronata TaxID=61149 RepID=A0A2P2PWI4_RHIMU
MLHTYVIKLYMGCLERADTDNKMTIYIQMTKTLNYMSYLICFISIL